MLRKMFVLFCNFEFFVLLEDIVREEYIILFFVLLIVVESRIRLVFFCFFMFSDVRDRLNLNMFMLGNVKLMLVEKMCFNVN